MRATTQTIRSEIQVTLVDKSHIHSFPFSKAVVAGFREFNVSNSPMKRSSPRAVRWLKREQLQSSL